MAAEKPCPNGNLDDICPEFVDFPHGSYNNLDLAAQFSTRGDLGSHADRDTYIGRHEGDGSSVVRSSDAYFGGLGKHGRDQGASEHGDKASIGVPVERLRRRNAQVHEAVSRNESIADIEGLGLVAEEQEKAVQDQRLAYGKGELHEPGNNNRRQRPAKGDDAACDEAMFAIW